MIRELLSLSQSHPIFFPLLCSWVAKLMTVRLGSMRVLQRDKSGCKDPLSIYCEEGNRTAYRSTIQLCEYFSTSGEFKQNIIKGLWGWGGVVWLQNKEMGKENTPNLWVWTGTGNANRRKHEGNTPRLPYDAMWCHVTPISEALLLQAHYKPSLLHSFRRNQSGTSLFLWLHRKQFSGKGAI